MTPNATATRCVPYRVFELTLCACVTWLILTTVFWTWFMWPENIHQASHIVSVSSKQIDLTIQYPPTTVKYTADLTPVYVLEEHHEALSYWYNAANRGLIPKQGNTLVHIDAHSDAALPSRVEWLPPFRFPISEKEILLMTQENDAFIVSSVIVGYLNRIIYIWSSWDDEQWTDYMSDYRSAIVLLGTMKTEPTNSTEPLCRCVSMSGEEEECHHMTGFRGLEEVEIDRQLCDLKLSYFYEIVADNKALELLETGTWLTDQENVILDIDEDFYGCEAACMPLYDMGVNETCIETIKMYVGQLFCPRNTQQERQLDVLFHQTIQRIMDFQPSNRNETIAFKRHLIGDILDSMAAHGLSNSLCSHVETARKSIISRYITHLMKYNRKQLTAIAEVGICVGNTPKAVGFYPANGMRICDGYNRPSQTAVFFHTPTTNEILERTELLQNILTLVKDPKLVTVCRSMRDGYTPRKFFHKIESDVLESLTKIYPKIKSESIHYDKDLLGGRFGWPDRHGTT